MKKIVSMKDIAEQLGVSVVTVSKALSNKEGVGVTLRAQIIDKANALGYRYMPQAKAALPAGYTVGVLVAHRFLGPSNGFYWDMYQNVLQQFSRQQSCAIMEEVQPEQESACSLPNLLAGRSIDGLILLGQLSRPYIDKLLRLGIPTLFLDFYDRRSPVDAVITDNIFGSCGMTNYLIENGHERVAFVGNIRNTSSILDRYVGYCKALLEAGLPIRSDWLIPDRDENGQIFDTFALPSDMPTAFVCNCDETAYRLMQDLHSRGIRVPEDVSLVGFDNYILSSIATPPITTMEVDMRGMAELAVKSILKKIANPGVVIGRRMVDGRIIQRKSVRKLNG